jgi:predicted membrane protein
MWGGLILLVIGVFLLLKRLDLALPHWLFSWEMIVIAIGLIIGAKRNFTGAAWIILVAVGVVFLMDDILPWNMHISRFIWPLAFVVAGIFLIVNSTERKRQLFIPEGDNVEDYLNITSLFSGAKKIVLSKNFRGGNLSTTFGGAEINLSQADFYGTAVLDVQCLFGGVEIVVPPHWEVRVDVNAIFGGIDDKRVQPLAVNSDRVLLIKGSCTFGGVDIKSY